MENLELTVFQLTVPDRVYNNSLQPYYEIIEVSFILYLSVFRPIPGDSFSWNSQ